MSSPRSMKAPAKKRVDDVTIAIDAFRRILRELRRAARRTELATGLSAAQTFVLNAVKSAPGSSLNDVAAMTLTDRSSVAAIVDRLVDDQYLKRQTAEDDRRRASLVITARGLRAVREAAPPPTMLLVDALRALSLPERARLAEGLVALTKHMGISEEPAGMLFEESRPRAASKPSR